MEGESDMRPVYEQEVDFANECEVASELSAKWNCEPRKMPPFYPVDWLLLSKGGKPRAWVEIKCRKNGIAQYPTLMLSLHKWLNGLRLSEETGLPFCLVVRWNEDVYYLHAQRDMQPEIRVSGRKDRGDPADLEPCVHLPIEWFIKLCPTT